MITEDSIQVVDLLIVRVVLSVSWYANVDVLSIQNNLDDGDHPFHLHGHRPWM